MTYDEAAAVTSVGAAFRGSNIKHFEEFQYFTGLTALGNDAFYKCANLVSLFVPEGVTTIGAGIVQNCKALEVLSLPSTLTSIGLMGSTGCVKLKTVYCYAKRAPALQNNNFFLDSGNLPGRVIYVPTDATGYDTNAGWQKALNQGYVFSYTL